MPQDFPDTYSFNLPHTGCDSHAHLAGKNMLPDIEEILERAFKTGIAHIAQIFLSAESYYNTKDIFDKYEQIFYTLAIHPNDILEKYNHSIMDNIKHIVKKDKKFKAIGETGLDYYHKEVPAHLQEKVFKEHLALAKEVNLPVIIHSRDAFEDTLRVLDELNFSGYPLIWHCFYGDKAQLDQLKKRDWYISIPGPITYPGNKDARAMLKDIPMNRLLLETDCPYLSPQGWRGQRNEPALTAITAKTVADILEIPVEELWTTCGENAKQIYRLI